MPIFLYCSLALPLLCFAGLLVGEKYLQTPVIQRIVVVASLLTLCCWLPVAGEVLLTKQVWQQPFVWFSVGDFAVHGFWFIDQFNAWLLLITALVFTLVCFYAAYTMQTEKHLNRFFAFLFLFVSAMYGLLLTDNLLVIYVCWELVGLCSYLLIGFWYEKPLAVQAAKKAFLLNRIGDLGFLAALSGVWAACHTWSLQTIAQHFPNAVALPYWEFICFGLVVAACAKSAQFPFSTWLPDAMQAPTPVSALLHAATMVVAGAYLLIRIEFLLPISLHHLVLGIGAISALWATWCACHQTEMKRILAFSTISQIGLVFVALGLGAVQAAWFHLLTHAFFKANLFLIVGWLVTNTKQNNLSDFSRVSDKYFFVPYCLSAAALIGVPLTSGFLSKEQILLALFAKLATTPTFYLGFIAFLVVCTLVLTTFYTLRQFFLLFGQEVYPHKAGSIVSYPTPHSSSSGRGENLPLWGKNDLEEVKNSPPRRGGAGGGVVLVINSLAIGTLFLPFSLNPLAAPYFVTTPIITTTLQLFTLFISLFCIGLGSWLAYQNRKPSNLKKKLLLWTVQWTNFDNKYIEKTATQLLFSPRLALFEQQIVHRLTDSVAIAGIVQAHVLAWADRQLLDGVVRGVVLLLGKIATSIRSLQNGNLQQSIAWALVGLILLGTGLFFL